MRDRLQSLLGRLSTTSKIPVVSAAGYDIQYSAYPTSHEAGRMSESVPNGPSELASPWRIPGSKIPAYGAATAVGSVGTVAAPLLSGFSFSLVGQLIGSSRPGVRWPDGTTLLLILAGLLFLAALHCALYAHQWEATPKGILDWWPNAEDNEDVRNKLYQQQQVLQELHELWATICVATFNLGIVCFFAAIAMFLIPPSGSAISVLRALSIFLISAAAVIEFVWSFVLREFVIKNPATASLRRTLGGHGAIRKAMRLLLAGLLY
jgi:hypothetical protein